MRYILVLIVGLLPGLGMAQDWEDRRLFNDAAPGSSLRIISSTDTSFFAPIIESFVLENPDVGVEYLVTGTADIDRVFRSDPKSYDLVISSAMDLQLKLANDGLALRLSTLSHPSWAQWRQSIFAFTSEPAAIVINLNAFDGEAIPQTRQDLIEVMRANPEVFRDKVGTYDIRQSGLGYLFATQDARASETFWRLMEVMGSLNARLYCCSGDMIDHLTDGTIVVAYNVLESYAAGRIEAGDNLKIILPADFPTTMMRTAMVSKDAADPELATDFVRHLITAQSVTAGGNLPLPPLTSRRDGEERATIALEPALMTYLDTLKRRKFLKEWEDAVIQN